MFANLEKAHQEKKATQIFLLTQLSEVWQSLSAAYDEACSLRDEVLPQALDAFFATEFGYREGKLDFLQMLDAQRTLFTIKRQYLQSLEACHLTLTEMERPVGLPLKNLQDTSDPKNKNGEITHAK